MWMKKKVRQFNLLKLGLNYSQIHLVCYWILITFKNIMFVNSLSIKYIYTYMNLIEYKLYNISFW